MQFLYYFIIVYILLIYHVIFNLQGYFMKNFISSAIKSLDPVEIERFAIKSGFQKRAPKKITSVELLNLYCLESIDKAPSFNDVAGIINDSTGKHPSRQAVAKRIDKEFSNFLKMILEHVINYKIIEEANIENYIKCFPRIIVQDSTIIKLPIRLFDDFSGVSNSNASVCNARIQGVYDLVSKSFIDFSVDKYSKNDITAADGLVVQYGDLILRDRGYLKIDEIKRLSNMHTLYIYRHMCSMSYRSIKDDKEINLSELLKNEGKIDMNVCLNNKDRTVVRLVAMAVNKETADLRRMRAKIQDKKHNSSKKKLFLMSWTIFITNLPVTEYDFKMIFALYSLRWRIEIIFKTWKSSMSFAVIHNVSYHQLHALLLARLITIVITMHCIYRRCEKHVRQNSGRYLSLLKLMRYIRVKKERLQEILEKIEKDIDNVISTLTRYCLYDKRKRPNYVEYKELILNRLPLS